MQSQTLERAAADPTPAEIAAATTRIRATWSEAERRKRGAWMFRGDWTAPAVPFDDESPAEW